jgi:hypothetical protein
MNKNEVKTIRVLLDSGSSHTMIDKTLVSRFKKRKSEAKFTTGMGIMNTSKQVNIYFTLPEFYEKKIINWKANVFKNHTRYDMIVG